MDGPADRPAYLDCAASTPMRPEAVDAMVPYLTQEFANPSGAHSMARRSRAAIEEAREIVAAELGFGPHDIVFTSGGTESDNLAIAGVAARTGGSVICPATEHHAVLHPVEALGGRVIGVRSDGQVDLERAHVRAVAGARPSGVEVRPGAILELRDFRPMLWRR